MPSSSPQIPYSSKNLEKISQHLAGLQRKKSSTFWESRRHDQRTIPNQKLGLLQVEGLYQSSSVKPPCLRLRRSKRFPMWIHLELRHRLHRIYKKRYVDKIPQLLKSHFSEYDLAKAWYLLQIMDRFQIKPSRVLEIGGGVGLVGLAIRSNNPQMRYVDVDLNEMLPGATMLALAVEPSQKLELIENGFEVGNSRFVNNIVLPKSDFDLGINVTSFQEMDHEQINEYMAYLESAITPGGHFISINRDKKVNDDLKLAFSHSDVPWPSGFREIYSEESIFSRYSGRKIKISTKVFLVS